MGHSLLCLFNFISFGLFSLQWKTHSTCDTLFIDREEPTSLSSYTENHLAEYSSLSASGLNVRLGDASRNAFREIYPPVKINRCWFHYTQRI